MTDTLIEQHEEDDEFGLFDKPEETKSKDKPEEKKPEEKPAVPPPEPSPLEKLEPKPELEPAEEFEMDLPTGEEPEPEIEADPIEEFYKSFKETDEEAEAKPAPKYSESEIVRGTARIIPNVSRLTRQDLEAESGTLQGERVSELTALLKKYGIDIDNYDPNDVKWDEWATEDIEQYNKLIQSIKFDNAAFDWRQDPIPPEVDIYAMSKVDLDLWPNVMFKSEIAWLNEISVMMAIKRALHIDDVGEDEHHIQYKISLHRGKRCAYLYTAGSPLYIEHEANTNIFKDYSDKTIKMIRYPSMRAGSSMDWFKAQRDAHIYNALKGLYLTTYKYYQSREHDQDENVKDDFMRFLQQYFEHNSVTNTGEGMVMMWRDTNEKRYVVQGQKKIAQQLKIWKETVLPRNQKISELIIEDLKSKYQQLLRDHGVTDADKIDLSTWKPAEADMFKRLKAFMVTGNINAIGDIATIVRAIDRDWILKAWQGTSKARCSLCDGRGTRSVARGKRLRTIECEQCKGTGEEPDPKNIIEDADIIRAVKWMVSGKIKDNPYMVIDRHAPIEIKAPMSYVSQNMKRQKEKGWSLPQMTARLQNAIANLIPNKVADRPPDLEALLRLKVPIEYYKQHTDYLPKWPPKDLLILDRLFTSALRSSRRFDDAIRDLRAKLKGATDEEDRNKIKAEIAKNEELKKNPPAPSLEDWERNFYVEIEGYPSMAVSPEAPLKFAPWAKALNPSEATPIYVYEYVGPAGLTRRRIITSDRKVEDLINYKYIGTVKDVIDVGVIGELENIEREIAAAQEKAGPKTKPVEAPKSELEVESKMIDGVVTSPMTITVNGSPFKLRLGDRLIVDNINEGVDWSVPGVAAFGAKLGMGPLYKPTPRPARQCPACKKWNARVREVHADTGMDEMELWCPDCRKSTPLD
jgi:hypothetical protein